MYRYMKKKPIFESFEHEKSWFIRVTLNCSKTVLMSFWNNKVQELHDEDIAVVALDMNKGKQYISNIKLEFKTKLSIVFLQLASVLP